MLMIMCKGLINCFRLWKAFILTNHSDTLLKFPVKVWSNCTQRKDDQKANLLWMMKCAKEGGKPQNQRSMYEKQVENKLKERRCPKVRGHRKSVLRWVLYYFILIQLDSQGSYLIKWYRRTSPRHLDVVTSGKHNVAWHWALKTGFYQTVGESHNHERVK